MFNSVQFNMFNLVSVKNWNLRTGIEWFNMVQHGHIYVFNICY